VRSSNSKMSEPRIAFLGAGQMATALARGFIDASVTRPENIIASDAYEPQLPRFQKDTGGATKTTKSNVEAVQNSDVVILSVKPQVMSALLQEIKEAVAASPHLVISIAAGITMETILKKLGSDTRLVRVMPNTPCLVGKTAAAYSLGGKATPEDGKLVAHLLSSVGLGTEVPERLLDAVTGVSGSGPAYVYQFIEALSDGGVAAGLPRDIASKLAAQTVLGAAQMVLQTGEHPGVLKDKVASPGGTTIAGLHALEKGGMRAAVMDAVLAATERSKELSKSE
jgi:pyrroline-5-carboxylate reductase